MSFPGCSSSWSHTFKGTGNEPFLVCTRKWVILPSKQLLLSMKWHTIIREILIVIEFFVVVRAATGVFGNSQFLGLCSNYAPPVKGKQLIKRHCCCWCYILSLRIWFLFISVFVSLLNSYSICCSFHFNLFGFVYNSFHSFNHSFNQLSLLRHFVISGQTQFRSLIAVHLLYISFPGSTVCLPHDFIFIVCWSFCQSR